MADYTALVRSSTNVDKGVLAPLISLQAARSLNTVGTATFRLPEIYDPSYWQRYMRFPIYREAGGARNLLGNTIWFFESAKWLYSDHQWEITAKDALTLINRPIVAYTQDTLYADKTLDNGNQAPADDLMKAFVRENMGALVVDPDRSISTYVTVEGDKSLGPVTEKTASFQDLFGTLTGIAGDSDSLGTPLYFDLVPQANGTFLFVVRTRFLGTDRTSRVVFSPAFNNLSEVELVFDYTNDVTVVYVGGVGDGAGRLIQTVIDTTRLAKSPFSRKEAFLDMRDEEDTTVLEAEGRAFLAKNTPKVVLNGTAVDTQTALFGRDYSFGDLVQAVAGKYKFNCLVSAFSVDYNSGKDAVDVKLKGEATL